MYSECDLYPLVFEFLLYSLNDTVKMNFFAHLQKVNKNNAAALEIALLRE